MVQTYMKKKQHAIMRRTVENPIAAKNTYLGYKNLKLSVLVWKVRPESYHIYYTINYELHKA